MTTVRRTVRSFLQIGMMACPGIVGCGSESGGSGSEGPSSTADAMPEAARQSNSPMLGGSPEDSHPTAQDATSSSEGDATELALDAADAALDAAEGSTTAKPLAELQSDYMTWKFGMFLHFNMGTFTGEEWATPHGDPRLFNPVGLDANQWATTAVAARAKYVVLTTKHHDGFCLWNSAFTDYDVGSSPWKGGMGDVVREYVDAMRSHGLLVGFYFSIWDRTNGDATGLPSIDFVKNQLKELLTNYGPISLLWFDGWGWQTAVTYNRIPYQEIRDYIRSLQPNVLVLENNHEHSLAHTDIIGYERNVEGTPPANNMLPAEVADNIRSDGKWFFSDGACSLKTLATLRASLTDAGGSHSNYLLDLTPNQQGQIPDCQVQLIAQLK
jgi:alpha-L-fucosidase